MLETVKEAKIGSIVPLLREIDNEIDVLDYFSKLSNCGKSRHSLLFQHENCSFGTAAPCLMVMGKGPNFEIKALNETGKKILAFIKKDFGFCDKVTYNKDRIHGILSPARKQMSEEQRLSAKNHIELINVLTAKLRMNGGNNMPSCGVYGILSPGFINGVPDEIGYIFYFADNMFLVDHAAKKSYFIANAFITDNKREKAHADCIKTLNSFEKLLAKKAQKNPKAKKKKFEAQYSIGKEELLASIKEIKRDIADGDLLFANASSAASCNFHANPLELYAAYRKLNTESTYYLSHDEGICMSSSSGTAISINTGNGKKISISMVTGQRKAKENADNDLQNRHEAALKSDEGETVRHIMLADAARNEMSKVCKPGTRHLESLFSSTRNADLSFTASGELKEELDALYAAASLINFWNGITKQKAFELSSPARRQSLGFHSGAVIMAESDGRVNVSSISSISLRKDKLAVAVSSAVFHNTNEEHEAEKNSMQVDELLSMAKEAGGMK